MISPVRPVAVVSLLVPALAGTSAARSPVSLTASPAHVTLLGAARATVRVTNSGSDRVVLDVGRAAFALDLRGRAKIVRRGSAHSAARWLVLRQRRLTLRPAGTVPLVIAAKLPPHAEPGDHAALVLLTTRPRSNAGVAVRLRMGIVVVVRAPGRVVRRIELQHLTVVRQGRMRILELLVANRGNVTESFGRAGATVLLGRGRTVLARLGTGPRELLPRTRGIVEFRYRGRVRGRVRARVALQTELGGSAVERTFRIRL